MTTRNDIVEAARSLQGMQWLHQGRNEEGSDCVGFVALVAQKSGAVPDIEFENNYRRRSDGETMVRLFREYCDPIEWRDAQPGDFMVVKYRETHWHCMIVSKREENLETEFYVIEAGRDGVTVDHRIDWAIKRRIHSAYQVRNLDG
jgi:cell wall-associated NlpC family hydrolase